MKKITNATELHYSLGSFSVGRVNLIQPCESQNTRFCIVTSQQFECLKKRAGIRTIRAENNSYLYEYSDKASWSLPGCMVSSWERHEKLPEFTMKEAENVAKAVGKGTKRRRTKNKGVFLTLGPRLSSRPRPNPTIQDENKLYFSDFFRQDWGGQEGMYLLRSKLCLATELARQRSIALNPGYMCLVGHYCCARQLLTSGICKPADCDEDCDSNTLGYVNSLHDDSCDLVAKKLVPLFINRFVNKIMSLKRVALSKKIKLTKKVKEISSLVGIGLPTTCAHNIICDSKLYNIALLSSFFIMFDFAMPLGHKTVHNFFAWSFVHCTALPILIFHDGTVRVSNDNSEDEHCVIVFAWGVNGGNKESNQNTNMQSAEKNEEDRKETDEFCNAIVNRISIMY